MLSNTVLKAALIASMVGGLAISTQANAACEFVSTKDGSPLAIKASPDDTPEAKEFLETCKNPYTAKVGAAYKVWKELKDKDGKTPEEQKEYIAAKKYYYKARREYNYNNCTGCHGGKLEGVMAPSLAKGGGQGAFDTKWVYAKNGTDKGMFETISGGTSGDKGSDGAMFVWHKQLEGHTGDGLSTDQILKAIAFIRANYSGTMPKTWEEANK